MRRRRGILPFMLQNACYCRQWEERNLVCLVTEDILSIDCLETEFSSTLPILCSVGLEGKDGEEKTENGRRKTELSFTSASECGETRKCSNKISLFPADCAGVFPWHRKSLFSHSIGFVLCSPTSLLLSSNLVVHLFRLEPISLRANGYNILRHLSEKTRTPSNSIILLQN